MGGTQIMAEVRTRRVEWQGPAQADRERGGRHLVGARAEQSDDDIAIRDGGFRVLGVAGKGPRSSTTRDIEGFGKA
jgi:hypothetical protein